MFSKALLRITGDYKKPQYEETSDIIEYCEKAGVKYDEIWIAKNENNRRLLNETFIHFVPQVLVFDKTKTNITVEEGKNCVGTMMFFLNDTLPKLIDTHDTTMFYKILNNCNVIKSNQNNSTPDYYFVISWAKYLPKMTLDIFQMINEQEAVNKTNASYILLNMDFLKEPDK
jgi:hypothetical protein